jgi:enoyl-CoA hydratase
MNQLLPMEIEMSGLYGRARVGIGSQKVTRLGMAEIELTYPRDGIALVTMNRPDKLNAMTSTMVESLHQTFSDIGKSRDVRVVVLTGSGRGFCAGLDLGGYGDAPGFEWNGSVEKGFAVQKHIASLIPKMRSIPQPIIAAVNGPAAGGGFALVLGSDLRICSDIARFNAAFIRIGLSACDIGTSWLLPRLIGGARAHEIMLTGRLFDAEEALRIGLVTEVLPPEVLLDAAYVKAQEIMLNSPIGVALTKEGMWASLEIPGLQAAIDMENRQQIMASFSDDARETQRAKREGRPPQYRS